MKFQIRNTIDGEKRYQKLYFWCPGCDSLHGINVIGDIAPKWDWDGNIENPTINPSIRVSGKITCHSYLRNGKIDFCGDSQHQLAGKLVDLPDLPDWFTNE